MNRAFETALQSTIKKENLSIEVTTHCNSNCSHCFVHAGLKKHSSLLISTVKEIVAEGYEVGYRHLHLTGGEPLLWNGLFDTLDFAFIIGYKTVFINSNGSMFSTELSNILASYNKISVSVSLEGPEPLHDYIRGEGSYRKAIIGIEKALNAGINLCIFTTCSKSLLPNLVHFADKVFKDFSTISGLVIIQLIRTQSEFFKMEDELLFPEEFIRAVKAVSLLNLGGLKIDFLENPLAFVASRLLKMPWMARSAPLYRPGRIVVLANGEIALSHSERNSIGSYKPGMIRNILVSRKYRKAVEPDENYCPNCRHYKICRKHGMIRPSEWFRNMQSGVVYCEQVLNRALL